MLVYRPNIEEIRGAIKARDPYMTNYVLDDTDLTNALFKEGRIEPLINNIFAFEKTDAIDLAMMAELSIYGFKIIETMDRYLVVGSLSDIIHLIRFCTNRNHFMESIISDIKAYYSPEYFEQLIEEGVFTKEDFSVSYRDLDSSQLLDITTESISILHCDLFSYSLNHYFEQYKGNEENYDGELIETRDRVSLLCNSFKDIYDKLDVSFDQLSKAITISYFIYGQELTAVTDFINKNNIKTFSLFKSISIFGTIRQDVVLITQPLSSFKLICDRSPRSALKMHELVDDMSAIYTIIQNKYESDIM